MNIHTRLVGALHPVILSLTAVVMVAALFEVSANRAEMMLGKRGTVTVQQIAMNDTDVARHL